MSGIRSHHMGTHRVERESYGNGKPKFECHYIAGKLQDAPDGTAADREWYPNGTPKTKNHYIAGKRTT